MIAPLHSTSLLRDPQGRQVTYLRLSITDRCNERCLYCMPEQFNSWTPRADVLSLKELLAIARAAVQCGVSAFKITGGEPLLRSDVADLVSALSEMTGVRSVSMTTNGTRLPALASSLAQAGLTRINVSLDALDPDRYRAITGGGELQQVLRGLEAAREAGISSIKLNTVLMRHKNEDQILPLVDFAAAHDFPIRFIELMPVSLTEMLDASNFLPLAEVRAILQAADSLEPLDPADAPPSNGPAQYYRLAQRNVRVGFIGAITNHDFCGSCNKMRVTCDGKLRPCLGNHLETDLTGALRPELDHEALLRLFEETLGKKPAEHDFRGNYQPQRIMTALGG